MAIGRLFRGLAENLDQTRKEKIANMGGLEDRMDSPSIPGSFTFPGGFNFLGGGFGGFIPNIANIADIVAQQQGPVLGPDDFGSYVIPASDPTYSSGFDYARSIAGGMPMSQVIAPGVSYSPEQPMGYTQEQLNTAIGTTPVEPPPTQEPDDPSFLGTGIGGVNIPIDRDIMRPPIREISGPTSDIRDFTQGMNFTNLFGMPSIKPPSLEPEEPKRLRPPIGGARPTLTLRPTEELINSVVTGGMITLPPGPTKAELFSTTGVNENNLDVTTVKPPSQDLDTPQRLRPPIGGGRPRPTLIPPTGGVGGISGPTPDIRDLILPPITSIENIAQDPRLANIPTITPPIVPPMDLPMSLPDILGIPTQTPPIMPPMDIPPMDIPPVDFPPIVELPPIRGIGRPNRNRFSIQQLPRGLF